MDILVVSEDPNFISAVHDIVDPLATGCSVASARVPRYALRNAKACAG